VLAKTSEDVDVTEETLPSPPVVTMMVETSRVELATRADVIVVFEVLLLVVVDSEVFSLLPSPPLLDDVFDVGETADVVVEASVVFDVMVVGVPFDVDVVVTTTVDEETTVVLCALPPSLPDVPAAVDVTVAPVPRFCLL